MRRTAKLAKSPVWLYHWALNKTVIGGANHGDQMWYEMMDPETRDISEAQEKLARTFYGYVTKFVRTGDPNGGDRPKWTPWSQGGRTMVFGKSNDERAGGSGRGQIAVLEEDAWGRDQCESWWGWSDKYED